MLQKNDSAQQGLNKSISVSWCFVFCFAEEVHHSLAKPTLKLTGDSAQFVLDSIMIGFVDFYRQMNHNKTLPKFY